MLYIFIYFCIILYILVYFCIILYILVYFLAMFLTLNLCENSDNALMASFLRNFLSSYNKISLFFLIWFFLGYTLLGVFHSAIAFNWTFQDWLINYEGGFVRRGLTGELILILTNIFFQNNLQYYYGINVHLVYFFSISLFCLIYHIFLYRLIKNEELNLEKFFIILSPLSIPFIIYNISAIARKEILLFITILFFIFLLDWLKKKDYR